MPVPRIFAAQLTPREQWTHVLASVFALGGCGFHLEGRTPLPATVLAPYLEAEDRQSDFVQSLERALRGQPARPCALRSRSGRIRSRSARADTPR